MKNKTVFSLLLSLFSIPGLADESSFSFSHTLSLQSVNSEESFDGAVTFDSYTFGGLELVGDEPLITETKQTLNTDYYNAVLDLNFAYERFYTSLSYSTEIGEVESTSSTYTPADDNTNLKQLPSDYDEWGITVGYMLVDDVSVFVGWKDKSLDNSDSWWDYSGLTAGAGYTYHLENASINFSLAYAAFDMDMSTSRSVTSGSSNGANYSDFIISNFPATGTAKGFSYSVKYTSALTANILFHASVKGQLYKADLVGPVAASFTLNDPFYGDMPVAFSGELRGESEESLILLMLGFSVYY
ncbi:hypothetical protein [Alteromonas lipolytica]|uniref:Uncharacterized protein n=1 Tax=Alteromonas lipolytica TaxID=1856405 RepID=A0A1E8FA68_9ALTE|nr:hypothetical protein [Alteromonas lipolytica]OFI32809.1 hypothetical protein BFC17_06600 [Alteromonas lipolytica]GGF72808.1 hypothetical protein GCM10011338_26230 [Alteromonas lipolytica]